MKLRRVALESPQVAGGLVGWPDIYGHDIVRSGAVERPPCSAAAHCLASWSCMRLVARLMIAGVALATGGLTAGCSAAVVPDAQGATNPAAIASPGRAITATVPPAAATKTAVDP